MMEKWDVREYNYCYEVRGGNRNGTQIPQKKNPAKHGQEHIWSGTRGSKNLYFFFHIKRGLIS